MANITRYNPFDELFGDFGKGFWLKPLSLPGEAELKIKLDVKEDEKSYTVRADIPGVNKDDIKIDIDGNMVSIRAEVKKSSEEKKGEKVLRSERYAGMTQRTFTLPLEIDVSGAVAKYEGGVLDLTLPKKAGVGATTLSVR